MRRGEFSVPLKVVLAAVLILAVTVLLLSIVGPNLDSLGAASGKTISDVFGQVGGFIGE